MPLIDGISRRGLQHRAIIALKEAQTMARDQVFEPRDWPTEPKLFPLLMCQTPVERKVNLHAGLPEFISTVTLVVVGRLVGQSAEQVNREIDDLAEQIEEALLLSLSFTDAIQQFQSIEVRASVTAEGKYQIGEVGITFTLVVYQAFGPAGPPLTDMQATMQSGIANTQPVVIDIT